MKLDDFYTVYTEKSKIIHYKHPDSDAIDYVKSNLQALQQDEWFFSRTVCGINTSTTSPHPWFICFPKNNFILNAKYCKRCKKILDNVGVK